MTYLIHKDYKEASKEVKIIPDVKSKITAFVGKGKKSYEDIIKEVQKTDNLTNDEIIKQIKEVNLEWYPLPVKPIVKPIEDIKEIEVVKK